MLRLAALAAALAFASALPARAQPIPPGQSAARISPGITPYDACRAGSPGNNYDATIGCYASTCANYPFAKLVDPTLDDAAFTVTCTGNATSTGSSANETSCLRAGEVRLINVLQTAGVAADFTCDGGEVLWPLLRGQENGIYVDHGCGVDAAGARNNCPDAAMLNLKARLGSTKWASRGSHARRFAMQAERGITHRAEIPGTFTYDPSGNPILRGIWYVDDRGQYVSTAHDVKDGPNLTLDKPRDAWMIGSQGWAGGAWCDDTSATNPRCKTADNTAGQDMPTVWSYGVFPTLLAINHGPSVEPNLCIANGFGTPDEATTSGTCPGDRLTRCWASGASTLRSSGGCCWDTNASGACNAGDYDISEGVGCQGFVDALSYDAGLGRHNAIMLQTANYTDGPTVAADTNTLMGQRAFHMSLSKIGSTCNSTGKQIFPGRGLTQATGSPGGTFTNPFPPIGYTVQASDFVRAYDPGAWSSSEYGVDGISVMPADWLGRTGRCTALTSTNCDAGLYDLNFGDALFWRHATFLYSMETTNGAGWINGAPGSRTVDFAYNTVLDSKNGATMDTGDGWRVRFNRFEAVNLLSTFSDRFEIVDNLHVGTGQFNPLWQVGLIGPQRDFVFSRNTFIGHSGGIAVMLGTVSRGRIEDNLFMGPLGYSLYFAPYVVIGTTTTKAYVRDLIIARNRFEDFDEGSSSANFSEAAIMFQKNLADGSTSATRDLAGIRIEDNYASARVTNACLVWIDDDRDGPAVMDETRPQVQIKGNLIYGTTPQVVCLGSNSGAQGDRSTVWPATGALPTYLPKASGNFANGVLDPELPGELICNSSAGANTRFPMQKALPRALRLGSAFFRCAIAAGADSAEDCSVTALDFYSCPGDGTAASDILHNCTLRGSLTGSLGEWGAAGSFAISNGGTIPLGEWLVGATTLGTAGTSSVHRSCVTVH